MSTTAVTALHVDDEDFVVASLIERCPKVMMIRELMMNAIEAWPWNGCQRASAYQQHCVFNRKRKEPDGQFWYGRQGRVASVEPARDTLALLQVRSRS